MDMVINSVKKTKILATLGPASSDMKTLTKMISSGMDAIRLNTAHGKIEEFEKIIRNVRKIKDIPIILDLKGPEIRISSDKEYDIRKGDRIRLSFGRSSLSLNHKFYAKPGTIVLVDEGLNKLKIRTCTKNNLELIALDDLVIRNKLRLNVPGLKHSFPALTETDKKFIGFGIRNKIDFIALSYTKDKNSVLAAKQALKGTDIGVIAKIETLDGVKNFDGILAESDGIMVARGDLGVEIRSEKLPMVQKSIIKKCNQAGKFVITATQMLQSMVVNANPTRAETSDVANAILDGTDIVMLSAETAVGKYPVQSIMEMARIASEIEGSVRSNVDLEASSTVSEAISKSIYEMTKILPVSKIITLTRTGYTARIISRFRLSRDIIAITPDNIVRKKLQLNYGVIAFEFSGFDSDSRIEKTTKFLFEKNIIGEDDLLLFTAGVFHTGSTNLIEVHKTKEILRSIRHRR